MEQLAEVGTHVGHADGAGKKGRVKQAFIIGAVPDRQDLIEGTTGPQQFDRPLESRSLVLFRELDVGLHGTVGKSPAQGRQRFPHGR